MLKPKRQNHMELAEKLERTQAYFSELENGTLIPSVIELLGIARFTDKPTQFFLPIQAETEWTLTDKEWQFLTHFRKTESEDVKDMVHGAVKTLTGIRSKGKKLRLPFPAG